VDKHLSEQNFNSEIIVALSPSTDNSQEILNRFNGLIKNLKTIHLNQNTGRGSAIKQAVMQAKGTWIIIMDADNSISIVEFNKMMPYLGIGNKNAPSDHQIVLGSRYLSGSHLEPNLPFARKFWGVIGRFFAHIFLLPKIKDPYCGFKCFSAQSAQKIFPLCKSIGWALDLESLVLAKRLGYEIKEMPIFYSHDSNSKQNLKTYLKTILESIAIFWYLIAGGYGLKK
jgi:dolichyl-phosphate beta-glucosyltransferase